jgi:Alpha/beta hydrolase domain
VSHTPSQRRRTRRAFVAAALVLACARVNVSDAAPGSAPAVDAHAAIPLTFKLMPALSNSVPNGTVLIASVRGAPRTNAVNLLHFGFVEEEYLVSGVIPHGDSAGVSFVSRLLVRRPAHSKDFFGTVELEPLGNGAEDSPIWRAVWPYVVENGDVWVGMTISQAGVYALKRADPSRYRQLVISDDELRWDIQTQVARAIRGAGGILDKIGFLKRADDFEGRLKLIAAGWGNAGCIEADFINKGYHSRARRDDAPSYADVRPRGLPLIDAYVIGSCPQAGAVATIPEAVAVVHVMTESNYLASAPTAALRRKDGDNPGVDWYRWYDVAGASDRNYLDQPQLSTAGFQFSAEGKLNSAEGCKLPLSTLPGWSLALRSILHNVDFWIRTGTPAPPGAAFELVKNSAIKRDNYGNALGGLRSDWVDVPISTVLPSTPGPARCEQFGHTIPFAKAELLKLYGNRGNYVTKVEDDVFALASNRYMRNEDASALRNAAKAADLPLPPGSVSVSTGPIGGWQLKGNVSGIEFAPICHLRLNEDKIAGTCTMEGYEAAVRGTLTDTRLQWEWPFKDGLTMQFTGTLESNTMKGVVKASGAEGQWTATRQSRMLRTTSARD